MLSKDVYQKIFEKISDNDIETFKSLAEVCRNSNKAAVIISDQKYKEFLNQNVYVYWKAYDGWGGYYKGEWKLSLTQPTQEEIDTMGNSKLVFVCQMKDIINKVIF